MEHLPTILVAGIIAVAFVAVIVSLVRKNRSGRSGCGCGCDSCPGKDLCHPENN